jgi:hypothetical protein
MTREQQIVLGDMAAHLLDNEVVQEVFKRMADDYVANWRDTTPCQTEQREAIYHQIQALEDFKAHLKIVADTGKFERAQLEKARDQRKSE